MALLYNHSTGKWEDVADDVVPQVVAAGTHTFQTGITVPVVTASGELGEIPSDKAYQFFRDGARLSTGHDLENFYDREDRKIQKENFGGAGLAAGLGAARAISFGGSDVLVNQLGLDKETNAVREQSPNASTLGEVGGLVAGSALLPFGGVAGAAERTGAAAERIAASGLANTSRAGQIAAQIGSKTLGSAVEGAVYGLGTGISEAALGRPEDVVSNLTSGIGMGALFGGALGFGFGSARAAKPIFDDFASTVTNKIDDLIQSTARKSGDTALKAALTARGEQALYQELKAAGVMADSEVAQQARSALINGDKDAADSIIKEAVSARKDLTKEGSRISAGLTDTIKSAEPAVKAEIQTALRAEANDIGGATRRLYDEYRQASAIFDQHVGTLEQNAAGTVFKDALKERMDASIGALNKSGTTADKALAKELKSMKLSAVHGIENEADEVIALKNIRETIQQHISDGALSDTGRKTARELRGEVARTLSTHPDQVIATFADHTDKYYQAYTKLLGFTSKGTKGLAKLMVDPASQAKIVPFFDKMTALAPEFKAFRQAGDDLGKKTVAASNAYKTYRRLATEQKLAGQRFGFGEFRKVFEEYAGAMPKDIDAAMQRLKTIEDATAQGLGPIDSAIRISKALGKPVKDLEAVLPFQRQFAAMDRLKALGGSAGDTLTVGKGATAYAANMVGGPGLAAAAVAAQGAYSNPLRIVKGLAQVERLSAKGAAVMDKAAKRAVGALISEPVRKGALILGTRTEQEKPLSRADKRKKYQQVAESVGKYNDPRAIADAMAASTGQLAEMPQIKMAMTQRLAQTAAYLNQHLPQDPIGNKQVIPRTYVPNDVEMGAYLRRVDAAQNPVNVLHQIASGHVSAEAVDALKTLYPDIYNRLQSDTISGIMNAGKDHKIPYRQRLLIKQVFGIDADYSQTGTFVGAMQANVAPTEDQGGRPTGATDTKPRKPIDVKPFTNLTEAQATTYKGATE